ncbi:DNA adenine methylase [Sphingobium sp. MI1205]|uniref:DNA adenine methylase n=1 Tax=Sphingobium sp. MI1205 TaxID=407020 RepID=UPI0007701BEB|nr:DNA adenine methylase [Sphingobium sp. MI1205]AMK18683.1 DNA adenine methylase [Sphingobium sp. MI1205]
MESSHLFDDFVQPVSPPAAYIGGKRRLSRMLVRAIERIPHHSYCEVFMGMGGVFLRRTRRPGAEYINDWSEDVSTFFRILQRHYVAFLDMLRFQLTTRSGFEKLLRVDPSTQTDLERAARFLYLQRLAFGGKVAGRNFGVDPMNSGGFDVTRLAPMLEQLHERLASVTIERLRWHDFIRRYDRPDTLFYLDPPYFGSEGDYGADLFDRSQFSTMAEQLSTIEGRFLLSINDCPEIRQLFGAFQMVEVDLLYSIGSGSPTDARELVISNVDMPLNRLLGASESG